MNGRRVGFSLSIALFLICLLYLISTYETLPDRLAVQFDFNNKPTSWQSKSGFIKLYLGVLAAVNIFLWLLKEFLTRIPDSLINVPWKKYWFSTEERRSMALFRMQTVLAYTLVFVNLVYLFVYHVVHQENSSSSFLYIPVDIGVYFILLLSLILLVGLFLYMRPPKEEI
ncbi:MAG TPA: DUF1648 domain-containing protein [Thermodesulfobacteriota bacterium]|nr:DUF1648 domain-containing protein [Thermodesulfobacteriota bacterium]